MVGQIGRRGLLVSALAAVATSARAAHDRRSVTFQVWRHGVQIGAHSVSVSSQDGRVVATGHATMRVKIGPIPVFNYRHEATEIWEGSRFVSLISRSVTNGKAETLDAKRVGAGVAITHSRGGTLMAAADCAPLTHWNRDALRRPLFNPQTGALVRCTVTCRGLEAVRYADGRSGLATSFALTGDADIIDWYDDAGVWAALRARGPDGSTINYRRL